MKFPFTLIACLAFAIPAMAQNQPDALLKQNVTPIYRNNSIGAFIQSDLGGHSENSISMSIGGLQYTHWANQHLGFRILAGYASYNGESGHKTIVPNRDTTINLLWHRNINMPVIGFGLLAQRHFYKSIYLFAGLELKGGYGKGTTDTTIQSNYYNGPLEAETTAGGHSNTSALFINVDALVGVKLQFSRIEFGLEALPVQMGYRHTNDGNNSTGIGEFNLGTISQRLFFNLRF